MAETEQENMEGRGGPSGRRSDVWSHFDVSKDGNGKDIATCKRCQKSLGAETKKGTSHLKRHHESCTREGGPPAKQPRPPPAAAGHYHIAESSELPPSSSCAHPASEGSWWSGQEECGAELARMITFHGYPSSIVENECFRRLVRGLNPHFQMPSRAAVEGTCHDEAKDAMNQLKETLARCSGKVSLATGTVETDHGSALYMACQFIDDEWALQKRIMQVFKTVIFPPHNHSALQGAEEICLHAPEAMVKQFFLPGNSSKLWEAIERWGLLGRIFSVSWDKELEKSLERKDFLNGGRLCPPNIQDSQVFEAPMIDQVLCVAYTSDVLDSVAVGILKGLNPTYEVACLNAAKDLHLSHEKRARYFSELGLNHIGRYGHRWYSYYCALEVLHKEYSDKDDSASTENDTMEAIERQLRELIARPTFRALQDKVGVLLKQSRFKESVFTDFLRKILGSIYRAIETLSSPSRPTFNLCFEELTNLLTVLQSEIVGASYDLSVVLDHSTIGGFIPGKNAGVVLQEAYGVLCNFVQRAYLHLSIPAVLDPRFKLEYVTIVLKDVIQSEAQVCISRVKKRLEDLFDEHRQKRCNILNGEGTSRMAEEIGTAAIDLDGYSQESITELERYLTDGLVPREEAGEGFDVLMWWKANSCRYPTVASMARDALAMPASDMLSPEHIARIKSMMSSYCLTYPEALSSDN